jgi:hypothetical protein
LGSNLPHRTWLMLSANNWQTSMAFRNCLAAVSSGSTLALLLRAMPPAFLALRLASAVAQPLHQSAENTTANR